MRDYAQLRSAFREIRLYRRGRPREHEAVLDPVLLRLDLDAWFDGPATRRALLELAGVRASAPDAVERARRWLELGLERGDVVAVAMPVRRLVMQVVGAAASIGPVEEAPPSDELIEVMLFDSIGQGLSSRLDSQVVRFTTTLADKRSLPGGVPEIEWRVVSGGSGVVRGIDGNPPSACHVAFFDDFSDTVPAAIAPPSDPAAPDAATLARALRPLNGPTLLTRRQLAGFAQPALLEMTNVFQLRRREAQVIELEHFNEKSAVFLPERAPESVYADDSVQRPLGIDVLAACLTFARDFSADRIVVTGHDPGVSQQRADCVKALLVGGPSSREAWTAIALATATDDDRRRISIWLVRTFPDDVPPFAQGRDAFDAAAWGVVFDRYMLALRPVAAEETSPDRFEVLPFIQVNKQFIPFEVAEDAGLPAARYTDMNAYNPTKPIPGDAGWHPTYVGERITLPPEWDPRHPGNPVDHLIAAGWDAHHGVRAAPPPPVEPGPPAIAPDVRAFGCGAHHLSTPFATADDRRATKRHAEVAFFQLGDAPAVVQCGAGEGPCRAAVCELFDPREYDFTYVPQGSVSASVRVLDAVTGAPVVAALVTLSGPASVPPRETDERGLVFFAKLAPGTYQVHADDVAYDSNVATLNVDAGGGPRLDFLIPGDPPAQQPAGGPPRDNHVDVPLQPVTVLIEVTDANPSDAAHAGLGFSTVDISSQTGTPLRRLTADKFGKCPLTLPKGVYQVTAHSPLREFLPATITIGVRGNDPPFVVPLPRRPQPVPTVELRMRLLDYDGEPFRDHALELEWSGGTLPLKTDDDGVVVPLVGSGPVAVPTTATTGRLHVKAAAPPAPPGTPDLTIIDVILTSFGPPSTDDGRIARLNNLGLLAATGVADLAGPGASARGELGLFAQLNAMPADPQDAVFDRLLDAHDNPKGPLVK